MQLTFHCTKHPRYKAMRRPTSDCRQCFVIWMMVSVLKQTFTRYWISYWKEHKTYV